MSLPTLAFEGRVNKSELRFTPGGDAVLNLDIACNSRRFNEDTRKWEDADVYWINGASLWGRKAEAANEQIGEGSIVTGVCKLRTRKYQDREGNNRSATDHMIESIGTVAVPSRDGGQQSSGGFQSPPSGQFQQPAAGGSWGAPDQDAPF